MPGPQSARDRKIDVVSASPPATLFRSIPLAGNAEQYSPGPPARPAGQECHPQRLSYPLTLHRAALSVQHYVPIRWPKSAHNLREISEPSQRQREAIVFVGRASPLAKVRGCDARDTHGQECPCYEVVRGRTTYERQGRWRAGLPLKMFLAMIVSSRTWKSNMPAQMKSAPFS
jgi:hypothetical protein